MTGESWPHALETVRGPIDRLKFDGVRNGMGSAAPSIVGLMDRGVLSPDLMCGLTLTLLSGQPRTPKLDSEGKASATDGGVWVREQFTCHRPIPADEAFEINGASTGRYVRRGRRYGTNVAETRTADGELLATNMTTGLLAYKVEEGLEDEVVGIPYDETPAPVPDLSRAEFNPHRGAISAAQVGDVLGGEDVLMSLAMMAARDTENPDNPIHSDIEKAKAAGLDRPIAGGSHVLAFALEPVMAAWGDEVLFHGARLDVRWKAPTHCDVHITSTVTVVDVNDTGVRLAAEVTLESGATAMVADIEIPR